jgi:predicted branched-subunit amino acid permease
MGPPAPAEGRPADRGYGAGARKGLPFAVATALLGVSLGVLARQLGWGVVAPVVCSAVVLSGSAQFAIASILGGGAGVGGLLADPEALGLDVVFPALFLVLLAEELRDRRSLVVAAFGGLIALGLVPFTPPGIPVIAACGAALLAALVLVDTVTSGQRLVLDARLAGVAAAGVALLLEAPMLLALVVAVATTALLRLAAS